VLGVADVGALHDKIERALTALPAPSGKRA
jgi:hypothetical protein